jgi:signal transduction histidine kinase
MKSLFVKLFLAFLLAMFISGAVFFSLAFRVKDWLLEHRHPEIAQQLQRGRMPPPPGFSDKGRPPDFPGMEPPLRHLRPHGPLPPPMFFDLGVQALIFLVVGGGICYLLAWRLTAPVRRLRQAVQQLANGDLTARTGITRGQRGDEISELGGDFDRMAERIESLLLSQKQLVRDISHELRSPLARLQVALGLARRKASADAEQALNRIEQEAERLNGMIGELLTLSLLENGSALTQAEPVDLRELLDEVVQDADFEAAESNRRVLMFAKAGPPVSGNRELLRRAVENVIRNGVRYTDEGTTVEVLLDQDQQNHVVIRVRDHGPGVPEAMLEAIFQPFCRVEEARDRQSGGTGIGLAITARTVALHGGMVTAGNRPEGGLEVLIRLPESHGTIR